ncbi:MAG: hypothetical protein JWP02_1156 [Acidimicrobiales bacterium]|nr:hypothetical protein [Acidimicrobiales bacterium]
MSRVSAAVLAVLALGACGRGGGGAKATAGGDKGAAERINVKQSDFPSGWTSSPHAASAEEQAVVRQFTECLGVPDVGSHTIADVHSPDFAQGQTTTASSEVRVVRTDADASADLAAFQSGKGPDCFRQTVERALPGRLPQGATTSNLSARQLEFPTLKDGTAAYQVSLTVSLGGGISLPVYADLIVFRAGTAEVTLNALNTGSPFAADLEKTLAMKMADRAR